MQVPSTYYHGRRHVVLIAVRRVRMGDLGAPTTQPKLYFLVGFRSFILKILEKLTDVDEKS